MPTNFIWYGLNTSFCFSSFLLLCVIQLSSNVHTCSFIHWPLRFMLLNHVIILRTKSTPSHPVECRPPRVLYSYSCMNAKSGNITVYQAIRRSYLRRILFLSRSFAPKIDPGRDLVSAKRPWNLFPRSFFKKKDASRAELVFQSGFADTALQILNFKSINGKFLNVTHYKLGNNVLRKSALNLS